MEFNWKFYIANYPDLKKNGINNYATALNHWIKFGKREGRICYFDYKNYLLNNKDLIKAGINTSDGAFNHWLKHGRFEGRKADLPNLYDAVTVNSVFDEVYLINLKEDTVKLERMKRKLTELNISYTLFEAVNGNKIFNKKKIIDRNGVICGYGAYGCKLSHVGILEDAKKNKYRKILVLEDDLFFDKEFNRKFRENYFDLIINQNTDYKLLYLGSSKDKFKKKIRDYGGFAIAIDSSIFNILINYKNDNRHIDEIYVDEFQMKNKKFIVFEPNIITANIMNSKTNNDQSWNLNHFNLNLNETQIDYMNSNKLDTMNFDIR